MKRETILLSVVAVVLVFFAGAFFSTSLVTGKEVYGSDSLNSEKNPALYTCKRVDVSTTGDAGCAGLANGYSCVDDSTNNMPAARTVFNDGTSYQHDELKRGCSYNWNSLNLCPREADGFAAALPETGDVCLNGAPTALCCK